MSEPVRGAAKALGWWGAGPLTVAVAGCGAFQSSIRSRWRARVSCGGSGAQSSARPCRWVEARHRNELARAGAGWAGAGAQLSAGRARSRRHDFHRARRARSVEATDLAVAQAVEAEGEDLAGDGDLGDLAPAALGDPLEGVGQRPVALGVLLRGLDQRPAQRPGAEVADVPEARLGV